MLPEDQIEGVLRHEFRGLVADLTPAADPLKRVKRFRIVRRRLALGSTLTASLVLAGTVWVAAPTADRGGRSRLQLAAYAFELPVGAHAVARPPRACSFPAAIGISAARRSPSNPKEPRIASAIIRNGGCVSILLTPAYEPGAAGHPYVFGTEVSASPIHIDSYRGTLGTYELIGRGTIDGVTVPSGTKHLVLALHIPATDGTVRNLLIAAHGVSADELIRIVSSGLAVPNTNHSATEG